jgi:anaerobic magnesium-protoporphyrin IX monomethyl ester cyclase
MYRHALCVYPYRVELGPYESFYPPLGLEIVAAALEPYCRSIDVVDLRRESGRTRDFLRPETDLVCFSVNWDREREFIREEILSVPRQIRTIVGGRHATEDPEWWLAECPNVDIVVRGHGEAAASEIASGLALDGIAGLSYRLNGHLVHTPARDCGRVAEDLGPNRRLRRYVYKLDSPDFPTGITFDTMLSSVGCPYNCRFCAFSRNPWGVKRKWSARPAEAVVRELEGIDAKLVGFVDDIFTHDMDRVGAICDLISARGIRKRYVVNARLEIAKRPDVLAKMERAGFSVLLLGIESAKDETLRSMKKGFDTRRAREYFRVLRKSRMILHGYFIVGSIGESEEDMLEIVPFARQLGVDTVSLCLLRNERYSGLEELVARSPGYHIAPDGGVYSDRYSQDDLRKIRDRIYRGFYTPRQMLNIAKKVVRGGLVTRRMLLRLPGFLWHAAAGRFNPAARAQRRALRRSRVRPS